jgi:hypothetical protein
MGIRPFSAGKGMCWQADHNDRMDASYSSSADIGCNVRILHSWFQ